MKSVTGGWKAVEVLKTLVQEQRPALQVWTEDLAPQVRGFPMETHPGQDMARATSNFMRQLTRAVSEPATQALDQKPGRGMRI
jgi:hypothetical protein